MHVFFQEFITHRKGNKELKMQIDILKTSDSDVGKKEKNNC